MKYKKAASISALGLASALLFAGCAGGAGGDSASNTTEPAAEPVKGGELVVASLPATIDPYATTTRSNWMVAASVCEGLFANGANMSVNDGLVESYEYDETTGVYTFKLRSGVKLHSGGTLTAADVVASLERFSAGDAGSTFAELVASITAEGDDTVIVTTKSPTGVIPALLATPDTGAYIQSAVSLEAAGDAELTGLDCTGPYKLDSFTVDSEAVVSRFDDYTARSEESDGAAGEKVAYADTIRFIPLNEANVVNQLRTGQVNVAPQFVSMDQLSVYESDPALNPVISDGSGFSLLQFNNQQGLFTDLKLRQAVLNAVNPEEIATLQLGGTEYFKDDSSMFPEGSDWYSTAGSDIYKDRDPETAKKLLAEAGYDGTPVRILYRPQSDNYGPLLQQQLEAVGFTVELLAVDNATFGSTRTDASAWDLFLAGGTAYSDPLTVVFLNDDFPGWWQTPEKKELVAKLTAGATLEDRKPVWDELQQLIWEQLPFVKLGHEPRLAVTSADVEGLTPAQGTARGYYNVWINSAE